MARRRTHGGKTPSAWIRSSADERAVSLGYVFDERRAESVATFAREFCRHSQGRWAGQRFDLQDWQYQDVIAPVFGWIRPDGTRRVRRAYVEIAKKNGKSSLASMLSLYMLLADHEPGATVANAAVDRDQASIVFDVAASMVRASPDLSAVLDIIDSRKTITHPASGSKYFVLSADSQKAEGQNISGLIQDELHRWRGDLFSVLHYAGAARRQPLFCSITTSGVYDPTTIGWQQHLYAQQVIDGTIEDLAFFGYIRAADPAADWTAPETWAAANPSLGVTVTAEELGEQCRAAQHSVGLENSFKRYRLNVWTQATERWIPLTAFDASAGHPIMEADYAGVPFHGGVDLGSISDLSVVAMLFPCPHDATALDVILRCFLPQDALREGRNAHLYQQWAREGVLSVTPGNITDERVLIDTVLADAARHGCTAIGIDRLFQAMGVSRDLSEHGLNVFPCTMGTMALSPLVDELERRILAKRFHHGGHPILRAAVDAVEMTVDAGGNRKPSRADRSKKIDALVATLLALDGQLRTPGGREPEYQVMVLGGRR